MGRSFTPKYRVEYRDCGDAPGAVLSVAKSMCWDGKRDGLPCNASLERWRKGYNESFKVGGSNIHVSESLGFCPFINKARIVRQKDNRTIALVTAPMFEAI